MQREKETALSYPIQSKKKKKRTRDLNNKLTQAHIIQQET